MKAILDLTDRQIEHLKTILYNDTQIDEFNAVMSRAIYKELECATSLSDIKEAADRPPGHRWCGPPVQTTKRGVGVDYHGYDLWLPKSKVKLVDGQITAPAAIIDAAKVWREENP